MTDDRPARGGETAGNVQATLFHADAKRLFADRPLSSAFRLLNRSLTLRLALLFAFLSTLILLGLGLFLRQAVEGHFWEQDREELYGRLAISRRILAEIPASELENALPRLESLMLASPEQSLTVRDATGVLLFCSAPLPPEWLLHGEPAAQNESSPPVRQGSGDAGHAGHGATSSGGQRGVFALASFQDGQVAQVAIVMNVEHHQHFMAGFARSLIWALGLAVLANALCAGYAARRGLMPLEAMAGLARRVSGERLHERLVLESLPLELQPLGQDLNAMLDRLEEAFTRLSGFASDIAHELRTPVTALMTQAQVALGRARSPEEYQETLYSTLEECERLSRMIGDMLFLAQAENGLMVLHRGKVDLAALVQSLCEFYGLLAEEKHIILTVEGAATTSGDALMLRRALGNLISNALRHTAPGGRICVRLKTLVSGAASIIVENPGDPIPPQHLERIFERFHRVDAARQRCGEGYESGAGGVGLGLAITRSIAIAHGGVIEASCADGLTRFTLILPVSGNAPRI
jgi:two-component system heavy metal sensor histidine kinase CusS